MSKGLTQLCEDFWDEAHAEASLSQILRTLSETLKISPDEDRDTTQFITLCAEISKELEDLSIDTEQHEERLE